MEIGKFLGLFVKVKQTSPTSWQARCPAHEDRKPSLSIEVTAEKILVHCHAGCTLGTILNAIDLKPKDLFLDSELESDEIIATFDYTDRNGHLLYQVCRTKGKKFFQRRPGKRTKWINNLEGVKPVPYRLHELRKAGPKRAILVVEGEKDADRLASLGFIATTNSGGAGKWKPAYSKYFEGKHVAVLADNDAPGKKHAEKVAALLRGVALSMRVCLFPELPKHGDVSDWFDKGGSPAELKKRINQTPLWLPPQAPGEKQFSVEDLMGMNLPEIKYIVPGIIPEGLTLLVGRPKARKSWACLGIALAVAAGGKALGEIDVEQGDVLYLALEDNARRLQYRFHKLLEEDAPPPNLFLATSWPRLGIDEGGLALLSVWLKNHPAARLIIIDTLARIKEKTVERKSLYDLDYDSLAGLQNLAGQAGVGIVCVHHTRKAEAEEPLDLVSGTLGLTAAADAVLLLKHAKSRAKSELYVIGRDIDERTLALTWGDDYPAFSLLGDADDYRRTENQQRVIDLLRDEEHPLSPKYIAEQVGMPNAALRQLLVAMLSQGLIYRPSRGLYTVHLEERQLGFKDEAPF